MLTAAEELSLISRFNSGEQAAGAKLIAAYQPLVRKIAKSWGGSDDAISEGNVGLLEAIRRFEPEHGARLGTYAAFWVRARIREYVEHQPRHASLNETTEDGREKIDLLADDREDQEQVYGDREERRARRDALRRALAGLEETEQEILISRHLLTAPVPLKVLGERFGVSGERVRQIEVRALAKVSRSCRGRAALTTQ